MGSLSENTKVNVYKGHFKKKKSLLILYTTISRFRNAAIKPKPNEKAKQWKRIRATVKTQQILRIKSEVWVLVRTDFGVEINLQNLFNKPYKCI